VVIYGLFLSSLLFTVTHNLFVAILQKIYETNPNTLLIPLGFQDP